MQTGSVAGLVLAILLPGFAFSQSKTAGALSGMITDPDDFAVPGALIAAISTETGAHFDATSDDRGEYRLPLLPPGVYNLKIEKSGFAEQDRTHVPVTVGQDLVVDAKLTLSGSTQIVEVPADAPLVETERTQQSNTLAQQEVRNLPIDRRDYLTF